MGFMAASRSPTRIVNLLQNLRQVPFGGGVQWSTFRENMRKHPAPFNGRLPNSPNAKFRPALELMPE